MAPLRIPIITVKAAGPDAIRGDLIGTPNNIDRDIVARRLDLQPRVIGDLPVVLGLVK
jgi:hypothetical protein